MRAVSIVVVLMAIFAMACGVSKAEQKVVAKDKIIERDGIKYEVNSEEPFTGIMVEYWPNGQKHWEVEIREGKPHGKGFIWYENGQKQQEVEYRDGKLHGTSIIWYEDGQKKLETQFRDGNLHNKYVHWHENGQKLFEGEYCDGELISEQRWDENGNPE